MQKRSIYIVLSQTNTLPARFIRFYTREPYAHVSLALDEDLDEMYSFARKGIYNPLNGGFVEEHLDQGILGRCKTAKCSVFELRVTQTQYNRIKQEIDLFKRDKNLYSYNFIGLLGVVLHIPITTEFSYFCSQFVATVLQRSHVHILDKESALVRPVDFRVNTHLTPIYTGLLTEYHDRRTTA